MTNTIHRIGQVCDYDNDTPAYAPDALPYRRATGVPKKGNAAWHEYTQNQHQPILTNTDTVCLNTKQQHLVNVVRDNTEYLVDRICAVHYPDVTVLGVTAGMDISRGILAVDIALSSNYPAIGTVTLHGVTDVTTTRQCVDSICSAITTHLLKQ